MARRKGYTVAYGTAIQNLRPHCKQLQLGHVQDLNARRVSDGRILANVIVAGQGLNELGAPCLTTEPRRGPRANWAGSLPTVTHRNQRVWLTPSESATAVLKW